jgi:hypothetical protein
MSTTHSQTLLHQDQGSDGQPAAHCVTHWQVAGAEARDGAASARTPSRQTTMALRESAEGRTEGLLSS